MKALLSILLGLLLIGGAFFLFSMFGVQTADDAVIDTDNNESTSSSTSVVGAVETWSAQTNQQLNNSWVFSVQVPTQVQVNNPDSGAYSFKYIGPNSMTATEITDGFFISLTAQSSTTLAEYLEENNNSQETVPVTFNGYEAQSYTSNSEIGNQVVPHIVFVLNDGTTVVDVTQSYYGPRSSEYQAIGQKMLNTLTFTRSQSQSQVTAPIIEVESPQAGDQVMSPVVVSGQARGYWFFEATAPVSVKSWDGEIIGEGFIEADGDWMTEEFVPFSGTISYTQEPGLNTATGTIMFHRANPSGLPENDAAIEITVQFADIPN